MITTNYSCRKSPATYREVFGVREYRYLFTANLLSLIGDQLTAIALAFIVFDRSGSPVLAALAFAGSYVAWILGGPLLCLAADRYPRRSVMIICDLVRMGLVLLLTVPGLHVGVLVALAFTAQLFRPPFASARASLMPEILHGDRYPVANGLDNIVAELTQVLGFVVGGVLITSFSAQSVLFADAGTFLVSALLIRHGVRARSATDPTTDLAGDRATERVDAPGGSWRREMTAGALLILRDARLRAYVLLLWTSSVLYAAEGLVVPLSRQYSGGAVTGGLLLAASPLGVIVGGLVLTRLCPPALRDRLMVPLALLSCVALVPVAARPPLAVVLALLLVSGFAAAFSIPLNALFGRAVPAAYRARAFGVAMSGLGVVQGLAMVAAGAAAEVLAPTSAVAGAGVLAALGVATVAARWPGPTLPAPAVRPVAHPEKDLSPA
jgi:predicted MFS family arabinose efflux permease